MAEFELENGHDLQTKADRPLAPLIGAPMAVTMVDESEGFAMALAAVMMLRKKLMFPATAFLVFGSLLAGQSVFQLFLASKTINLTGDPSSGVVVVFCIYTFMAFIFLTVSLTSNVANVISFVAIVVSFALTAKANSAGASKSWDVASGWANLVVAATGFYLAAAIMLGETYRRPVLPVGDLSRFWIPPGARDANISRVPSEATAFSR
ncbi:hypothetical protein HDU93_008419, partial [Gonapodya sp. JEL0774]